MYYDYGYGPKYIGSVQLWSLHRTYPDYRFANVYLVNIWYNKLEGFPQSETESTVLNAKKELARIADTFVLPER